MLLRGVEKDDTERGRHLQARLHQAAHQVRRSIYVLTKEEGGRHTPFFAGYRPQFYFRTTDVTGSLKLLSAPEMCMPGDNVEIEVDLVDKPVAMEPDQLRHPRGGRTIGSGTVTSIIE